MTFLWLVFTLWNAVRGCWRCPPSYPPDYCQEQRQTLSFGALMFLFPMPEKKKKPNQKRNLWTNYSKESKCHLKWFLLCILTELTSCHLLRFPTPSRVARHWRQHSWRQAKPVQPFLRGLLKAPQSRAANLPTLPLLHPQLCQGAASFTWDAPYHGTT